MDPLTISALINTGGNALGGLFSWLGGRGARNAAQSQYKTDRRGLLGMLGKDVIDPRGILSQLDAASFPQLQQQGRAIQKQTGNINAPDAMGALFERLQGGRNSLLAQLMQQNQLGKSNRDFNIRSQLFGNSAQNLSRYL